MPSAEMFSSFIPWLTTLTRSLSSGITRLCTVAMLASSSACALTRMTTSLHTWRPFTCLSRSSVRWSYLNRKEGGLRCAHNTDSFFDNVCELDLVFNFYKVCGGFLAFVLLPNRYGHQVYAILDEIFLAGEIEETSKDVVLSRLETLEKLE